MLTLKVKRFDGPGRWWWVLSGPGGEFLADHEVSLDESCWQYEAFTDAYRYLRLHAAPDRRTVSEADIMAKLGRWIGSEVFGPMGEALVARAPVTVRVVIPEAARVLAFRPLELARVQNTVLALARVSLVMQVEAGARGPVRTKAPITDHVRMLGLFSLPTGTSVLNLRRERHGLTRLVQAVAQTQNRSILLRVVQYGVTRARLREVVEEADGWDVIHISAHGLGGGLLLENEDGTPDLVTGRELVDMLGATADRVRLVTLSSCSSAALTIAEHRRLLGLGRAPAGPSPLSDEQSWPEGSQPGQVIPVLAADLADRLDVAAIGMRYPITDEFAIGLSAELYGLLLGRGQPVARALALALPKVVPDPATPSWPAISVGTPALFGSRAVDAVVLAPPGGPVVFDEHQVRKMARFPEQPERFVGRSMVLTQAGQVLAPGSGHSGVLLYGMAGVGKTASALELAYTHREGFRAMVWYRAPTKGDHVADALADLAERLEAALPGLALRHRLDDTHELRRFLPTLTEFCRTVRVLFVLDNLESLVTDDGVWRDARWGEVIAALIGHRGLSRVLLTSRRLIVGLGDRISAHLVNPLSADEVLLLARELPHLRALIEGTVPGLAIDDGRQLAVRVLRTAQGHPALLELADRQAADHGRLALLRARLAEADQVWSESGIRMEDFFGTGQAGAVADDYLRVLDTWTRGVVGSLTEDAGRLFIMLSLLEGDDRLQPVVEGIWEKLHQMGETEVPDLGSPLRVLAVSGLVTASLFPGGDILVYQVHPAVAAVGHALAEADFRAQVDRLAADGWLSGIVVASRHEHDGNDNWLVRTGWLVRKASRGAVPYLLRLGDWQTAAAMLEQLIARDHSVETVQAMLPATRAIVDRARDTDDEMSAQCLLVSALLVVDPPAAENLALAALAKPGFGRNSDIVKMTHKLAHYYQASGRLAESLSKIEDLLQRECGPQTRLCFRAERVLLRVQLHEEFDAVEEMRQLREESDELGEGDGEGEFFQPWQVREQLLLTSANVALQAERWQEALDYYAAVCELEKRRDAPVGHTAITRFSCYGPLLRLGRIEEARMVLSECREVFERVRDMRHLGKTHAALGHVEDQRGHGDVTIEHLRTALRYFYLTRDVTDIADGHSDLGRCLIVYAKDFSDGYLHTLVGAFLGTLIGRALVPESLSRLAKGLRAVGAVPATLDAVQEEIDQFDGLRLGQLLSLYWPNRDNLKRAFANMVDTILASAAKDDLDLVQFLATWDPIISGIVASADGDEQAKKLVDQTLRETESKTKTWKALARALQSIHAGERGWNLVAGDQFDIAIIRRTLAALADSNLVPPTLWPLMPLRNWLGKLIRVLREGDSDQANAVVEEILAVNGTREIGLSGVLQAVIAVGPDKVYLAGHSPVLESVIATLRHYLAPQSGQEPISLAESS
ncbi:MAG TPA: CHAT domain-containing protein [Actinophytocola sp.]|uniref:CHAT domain-containing protein n=1 Tax=Actinophytocola sp. TaxID=1872138 RepID=UPI002DBF0157|nr:CHAT domain-containing protein [Actinophytocola sp.]HEU5472709.1 CHAT domain-containing protein [Actinophytocola sp.]